MLVAVFVLLLPYHLFDGINKPLWVFGGHRHVPLSVAAPYDHGAVLVQARGEHHTGSQKGIEIGFNVAAPVGPGNVVDEKGQEAGLDADRPVGSNVDLSGKDRHVQDHNQNKNPAQDPDR